MNEDLANVHSLSSSQSSSSGPSSAASLLQGSETVMLRHVSGATAISPSPRRGQANSVGGVEAVYPQPISTYL